VEDKNTSFSVLGKDNWIYYWSMQEWTPSKSRKSWFVNLEGFNVFYMRANSADARWTYGFRPEGGHDSKTEFGQHGFSTEHEAKKSALSRVANLIVERDCKSD
jgi:hypothetical protein